MSATTILVIGLMFVTILMFSAPSHSTKRIYVPVDIEVPQKAGCGPIIIAVTILLLLAMMYH